ncbi:MAG: inositol monophosphatase family protein [Bacteroidales bacterium]
MDYQKLCMQVADLARETGNYILSQRGQLEKDSINRKDTNDFVTHVDVASEKKITESLSTILPGSGFLAEEEKRVTGKEYTWIIDPLDGTTNFIHGMPPFSVSIALQHKIDGLVLGVVYEIVSGECFYTWHNAPSYLNGQEIRVSETPTLADSLVGTGFPYTDFSRYTDYMKSLEYFMKNTQGVRRPGSAAVDLCYVACGRYDAFWEYHLKAWDVAAGSLLVKNAGGRVSDFAGEDGYMHNSEMLASNAQVFDELLRVVTGFFPKKP